MRHTVRHALLQMHPELIQALHHLLVAAQQMAASQRRHSKLAVFDYAAIQLLTFYPNGLTAGELGDALGLSTGSVTRLIVRLQDEGQVIKQPTPNDGRSVTLTATDKARRIIHDDLIRTLGSVGPKALPSRSELAAASVVLQIGATKTG